MAILSYPDHKAIFIAHVKCAGTTLYNKFGHVWGINTKTEDYDFVLGKTVVPPNTISKASYWKKLLPDYFMFTFIRNPYDRVVSHYFYKQKAHKELKKQSFEKFIMSSVSIPRPKAPISVWKNIPALVDILDIPNDEIDFIGRFENLQNDIDAVCKILKIENAKISHLNPSGRKGVHYRDLYSEKTKKIIKQSYGEDLEKFNYKF